ncbi:MAG: hypothetical protein IPN94_17515 [Sphingobacteriales bacterium]|nr:hypothetical protein [Sphingobacteriales bacterium]
MEKPLLGQKALTAVFFVWLMNQSPLFVSAQTINDNHSVKSFVWTQTTAVVQVSLLPIKKPPLEQKALRAVCFI